MSLGFVLGLLLVCAAARSAAAEPTIAVDVRAGVPFDGNDLRRALAARLPPDRSRVELRVALATTGAAGVVQITAGDRVRDVDVAGLQGEAAARLVALAASDLLLDDLADAPPPQSSKRSAGLTIGAIGAVSSWPQALAGGAVDVALPANLAFELGGATLVDANLKMTALTARLSATVRPHEIVELRAGVTLAPLFVSDGVGDRTVLVGGHAVARLHFAVQPRVHAVIAAGADLFATRTEYRMGGAPLFITPRFAPSIGLGIEVTP